MTRFYLITCLLLPFALTAQADFSSQLPLLVIDTEGDTIVDEPKIMARMGIVDNGPGNLNRPTDDFNGYEGWVGIEIRGSSSQSFPKKGFGLETREENGDDLETELLGFPEEEDWVLHGPYSDKSLIRNALLYDLAGETMAWAPRVRMVELVINGNYRGVYLFTERVKRDKNRIDVNKLKDDEIEGDDLTGGYILKFDKFTGESDDHQTAFLSNYRADTESGQSVPILFHYPKPEDIVAEQRNYISAWVHDFEDRLMGPDWLDPVRGYARDVDLESVADMFIYNEISRNVDGYRLSTYFSKQKDSDGGQLTMGPVWDFNLAFGNADYCRGDEVEGWGYEFSDYCPEDGFQIPVWWPRLIADPAVLTLVKERYTTLRMTTLSDEALTGRIDSFVDLMGTAAIDRNFNRWPVLGERVWPNSFVGDTHAEEIDFLTDWALDRLEWLDGQWLNINSVDGPAAADGLRLSIFPNPAGAGATLHVRSPERRLVGYHVEISDALGRTLLRAKANRPIATPTTMAAGLYKVAVFDERNQFVTSKKWVVR